ncbi:uncharacterized protein LOC127852563 [Dreissena polymorpha]|uniref:uncharacterized protein LOC127852563 n=1 Tax=Dreissena polymorpha TaxID=45954 RepID=UPI002263B481|nr:uncharacterized protein LOC127852563 [Dreissena polymorpha]
MDSLVEVEVEFPYTAEQPDELTIKVGDVIKNVVMEDGGWWEGELNGKKGMFPDNFVKVRKAPEKEAAKKDDGKKDDGKKKDIQATKRQSVKDLANKLKLGQVGHEGPPMMKRKDTNTKKKRAKVVFSYEPEQEDELKLDIGDMVEVLKQVIWDGGWWEGELNGKKGMFPDNFVKVRKAPEKEAAKKDDGKKDDGKKKDIQATKRQSVKDLANKLKLGQVGHEGPPMMKRKDTNTKKKRAKVVFSYEPEQEDELKLDIGDMVEVLKQEEEGWWEGIVNGKQGMFPSNFVEIIEEGDSTEPAVENTEERLIKGKKIQGVGLGNIFNDGPIKLRKTTGNSQEQPKAEKREEPAIRKPKGVQTPDRNLAYAQIESNCMQLNHEKSSSEIDPIFTEDIDYFDDDNKHYIDSLYNQKSFETSLFDHYDETDVSFVRNYSSMYYIEGNNDDNYSFGMSDQHQFSTESRKQDIQGVMNVLGDLDDCLHQESSDQNPSSPSVTTKRSQVADDVLTGFEKMETLACWGQMDLTPPQKLSFCKAIDSVYVTKKRQFDSTEKNVESTPGRLSKNSNVDTERITKVLTFGMGDPLGGFVKFTPVTDCHGHSVLVPKPIEAGSSDFHSPAMIKVSDTQTSTPRSPKTYLQSLNKSGTLSPFIKSIADKYKLFEKPAPHFKSINVDVAEDLSHGSFMLQHTLDVSYQDEEMNETSDVDVKAQSPTDEDIDHMLNNYIYDVVCGERNCDMNDFPCKSESDSKLGSHVASNMSVVVCIDEDSVKLSREALSEDSFDPQQLPSSLDTSAVLSMTDVNNDTDALETSVLLSMTDMNYDTVESIKEKAENDLDPTDPQEVPKNVAKSPAVLSLILKSNSASLSSAFLSKHLVKTSEKDFTLPGSGNAVKASSYCRIPFTNDSPSFWFSKDVSESPISQGRELRVKSPKRSCSELITKCEKMINSEISGDSLLPPNTATAFFSGDQSPAKKRRRRTLSDLETNTDYKVSDKSKDAIGELPNEIGSVETYFGITNEPCPESTQVSRESLKTMLDTNCIPECHVTSKATSLCASTSRTSKSPLGVHCSGSLENSTTFIDACSEKPKKQGFFRRLFTRIRKSSEQKKESVQLLKYTKLSDTHMVAKQSEKSSLKSDLEKFTSCFHDSSFQHHSEFIEECVPNESISGEVHERIPPSAVDEESQTVVLHSAYCCEVDAFVQYDNKGKFSKEMHANGDAKATDEIGKVNKRVKALAGTSELRKLAAAEYEVDNSLMKSDEDGKIPQVELASVDGRETDRVNVVSSTVETLAETRYSLYSAISSAVQACSDLLGERKIEGARYIFNNETAGDITPDPDALVKDLQGLDLSATPQYAKTDDVDQEMRTVLNDAIGSLDNILIDSFASSLSESPVKESDMDKDMTDGTDVGDMRGTKAVELEELVLHVVGRRCLLHEPEQYKVLKDDMADKTVEVHDDSILNIVGTKCEIHETGNDDDELEYVPVEYEMHVKSSISALAKPVHVSINNCSSSNVNFDEAFEVDNHEELNDLPSSTPMPSSAQLQTLTRNEDVLNNIRNDWGEDIENNAEFANEYDYYPTEYDYYPTEESLKLDDFEASIAPDGDLLNKSRGSSLQESLDAIQDQEDQELAEISVQFAIESITEDAATGEGPVLCNNLISSKKNDQFYNLSDVSNDDSSFCSNKMYEHFLSTSGIMHVGMVIYCLLFWQKFGLKHAIRTHLCGCSRLDTKPMEKALVRYSYVGEHEDELSLTEGEIINVLDKDLEDSGWWRGEINGRVGVFPDNFVELIKEEPSDKASRPMVIPAPQPKPKKPPPPVQPAQPAVSKPGPPKLPDKGPVISAEQAKPEPEKEEKPAPVQPTVPSKKPIFPPPPLTKKPTKTIDLKDIENKDDGKHGFEAVEPTSDKLVHLTATRPKGPTKRPPSQPKNAVNIIQDEERNGEVKETHEKPALTKADKPDRPDMVGGKTAPVSRPTEPPTSTVNAHLQSAIDELHKELIDLKANTVSKTAFNELKSENEHLKQELESMKTQYSRRFRDIMVEIDEEKKIRLSTQVEMERIRKLVAESHV